jgi:hypothetical protein
MKADGRSGERARCCSSGRAAASDALQGLRKEITATRNRLEKLIAEERSFRLDLFGAGGPGDRAGVVRRSVDQQSGRPPRGSLEGRDHRRIRTSRSCRRRLLSTTSVK